MQHCTLTLVAVSVSPRNVV